MDEGRSDRCRRRVRKSPSTRGSLLVDDGAVAHLVERFEVRYLQPLHDADGGVEPSVNTQIRPLVDG